MSLGSDKRAAGLVDLAAHGSDHKLQFTLNGMCEFEDVSEGKNFLEFVSEVQAAGERVEMRAMRRLFWVGLLEHHPEITEREAGRVVQDVGGIAVAFEVAGEALRAALPDGEGEGDTDEGKGQPA